MTTTDDAPMEPFSERARERQAALDAKAARGEKPQWTDLIGILEPNPDLPDCQSWGLRGELKCDLPNGHEGEHRAEVTW